MLKNLKKALVKNKTKAVSLLTGLCIIAPSLTQAAIGISTPTVNSGELIRASDWNKVKLDLETLAAAVGSLQNQTWESSGSNTYYDSGNVGIGINAPTGVLHLFATTPPANSVLLQLGTTDDPDRVRIDEDGDMTIDGKLVVRDSDIYESGGDLELSGEDNLYLSVDWNNNDADTNVIYFGKNSDGAGANFVELMRLTEAGRLGVGISNPISALHVAGAVQIAGDAAACVAAKAGALRYDGGAMERCDGTTWDALATTNVSDNLGTHVAEQNIDLDGFRLVGEGGLEGIGIDANGAVGIGTDNPITILDVVSDTASNLTVRTTAVTGQNSAVIITGAQTTSTTEDISALKLFNKDSTPFEGARISLRNGDGADSTAEGDLVFSTNTGSANSLTEKMRILDDGKVGIGTSGPVAQLQVLVNTPAANEIVFQVGTNADTNRFSVDEDGDVFSDGNYYVGGGNLLSNNGSVTAAGEDNLYLVTDWNNNDAENRAIIFGKNGVGGGGGFQELGRINENGRVGINENNPANRLHVVENNAIDRVATFVNQATTGSPEGLLVVTGQGAGAGANFAVGTGSESSHTKKFVVTNEGNVGVGTQSPLHLLHLVGGNTLGAFGSLTLNNAPFRILDGASSNLYMDGNSIITASAPFLLGTSDNNSLSFGTNDTSRVTITSAGNVGIGTASAGSNLEVANTGESIRIDANTHVSGWAGIWLGQTSVSPTAANAVLLSNGNETVLNAPTGEEISFRIANSPVATMSSTGELEVNSVSSDGTGKVVCIKNDGNLGTCTNAPNASGVCSCS
ncbi:hypothetical protein GW756_01410 [bacterium]|nr:hypothetical protein [bacterium]NCQ55012.1 hypothetical protein [Candidatus Parcubacteria bacterium]NCS67056.1 hypothetical protein [Candidatus Peregrinibacteria bacterium]NCS96002.1 hypothetical protein [bacterium]